MTNNKYETIIGLEIHVQLKTKSKMFCGCDNDAENKKPNSCVCPVCMGHPGTLPVLNKKAVEFGILAASALKMEINHHSKFDRKNYFYPDLPKGYQISQFDEPLARAGFLEIDLDGQRHQVGLDRLHLEEDAAKNFHTADASLIDFNRAGTPLIEIVTKPDLRSPQEAKIFLQTLRLLMRYLKVSDADMEKGHLRCDANISLRPVGYVGLYPKTEIKNLNSFRAVEKALIFEQQRQEKLFIAGTPVDRESTRGWDEKKNETVEQRSKESFADYRYFPEPDLPPLKFTRTEIDKIKTELPELPWEKRDRFILEYGFRLADAEIFSQNPELANYAEKVLSESQAWLADLDNAGKNDKKFNQEKLASLAAGWLINKLGALLNDKKILIQDCRITPENMAEFLALLFLEKINSSAGQVILEEMFNTGEDPSEIMQTKNLGQMDDEIILKKIADEIIKNNPQQAEDYRRGKEVLLKFFVGKMMQATSGKAQPQIVEKIFRDEFKIVNHD